jgi:hypothetical protein
MINHWRILNIPLAICLSTVLFLLSCSDNSPPGPETDLLAHLNALPDVEATEISPGHSYCERQFQIDIIQPLDHANPDGESFTQRLYLSHVDESLPVVFFPSGYWSRATTLYELTEIMACNQIAASHRFYDGAVPDNLDWQYLTIEQAAGDFHKIVDIFKQIYAGTWVSTGRSKSGMSAVFHRRFFPDDVEATVAYAAPLPLGNPDQRYMTWLDSQGTEECQNRTKQFQRALLLNRAELEPMLDSYFDDLNTSPCCDIDIVFEWLVTEYRYTFWQQQNPDCEAIPDTTASAAEVFSHLIQVCWHASTYSENQSTTSLAYHYQLLTEFGDIVYDNAHLLDLLNDTDGSTVALLAPQGVDLIFDPTVMPDIVGWLQASGDRIIYIYGGMDYNTAVGIDLTGAADALKITEPDADHGVLISDLTDQQLVLSTLESWLGFEIGN